MAVNPNTGLTSGPPKPAKKKPVAKKPVVGKKKPKPTLRPEYNLVFDPTGQQSELLQGELDAIRDLYLSSAGRNIEEEPDKRVALEQAGLLKPTVSKKKASELKRGGSDEFASAMDAIDAVGKQIGDKWLFRKDEETDTERFIEQEAFPALGRAVERAVRPAMDAPVLGGKTTVGETLFSGTQAATKGAAKLVSSAPVFSTGTLGGGIAGAPGLSPGYARKKDGEAVTLGEVSTAFEELAANPNRIVPVGVKHPNGLPVPDPLLESILDRSASGESAGEVGVTVLPPESRISAVNMLALSQWSRANGWPVDEWDALPLNEKLWRAGNKNDYGKLMARSVVKFLAAQGAVPAGLVGISDASAQAAFKGEYDDAKQLVSAAIAPISQYSDVRNSRGEWAAFAEFLRDNPAEAGLALNIAARTISRGAGAVGRSQVVAKAAEGTGRVGSAARSVRERSQVGVPVIAQGPTVYTAPTVPRVPEVRPWPGPLEAALPNDIQNLRARDRLWSEYEDAIEKFNETGELTPISTPILVGYQGRGLLGNMYLQAVKRRAIEGISPIQSSYLRRQKGARPTRLAGNVMQGLKLDIAGILERAISETSENQKIKRPVDPWVKERAAWNLTRPLVTFKDKPYTPAFEAAMFRRQAAELRQQIADRQASASGDRIVRQTRAETNQLKFWDEYAAFLDRLENAVVPEYAMTQLREAAKPLGLDNTRIVSEMMGISFKEANERNYIRVLLTDPDISEAAQATKVRQNTRLQVLSKSQSRIQSLSKKIVQYADETGWGKYGPSKSRARYELTRASLVRELQRAERIAAKTGEDALAAVYADALSKLDVGQAGNFLEALAAAKTLVDLEDLTLPKAAVESLVPEQRRLYEEAEKAKGEVTRLVAERAAAFAQLGKKRVTERDVASNKERLARIEEEIVPVREFAAAGDEASVSRLSQLEARAEKERLDLAAREVIVRTKVPFAAAKVAYKKNTRILVREFEKGRPVLSTTDTQAVLSVSEQFAVVRALRVREMNYYRIDRALSETLDSFIARVEAADQGAVLHLMQRSDKQNVGYVTSVDSDRSLAGTLAFSRSGRIKESTGYTFAMGLESPNMWQNLLFDTAELISAEAMALRVERIIIENSVAFRFTDQAIADAQMRVASGQSWVGDNGRVDTRRKESDLDGVDMNNDDAVADATFREALAWVIRSQGVDYDANEVVVLNLRSPKASKPSESQAKGVVGVTDPEYLGELMWRQLIDRTIDPDAPGEYYLIPRSTYRGIQDSLKDESFSFKRPADRNWFKTNLFSYYGADKITRAWRTFTLNILPRTAFVNISGSMILAVEGGASPYAMKLAFMAIHNIPVKMPDGTTRLLPVPPELRQRYYEQLFSDPRYAKITRDNMLDEPSPAQGALAWGANYMNSIRYLNGMSEDFGRLAIWYQQAYPEAIRFERAASGKNAFFASARRLNEDAIDLLESMARGDDVWRAKHEAWMQKSFDFLGDLHSGGKTASLLRIAFPFYQWYKHMIKLQLLTMPIKYPGRALVLQRIGEIGQEYQRMHGATAPWGLDFVPIPGMEPKIDTSLGSAQEMFTGLSSANIWPAYTWSQFATRDGDFSMYKALVSMLNPEVSNSGLIALAASSMIPGKGVVTELNPNSTSLSNLFVPAVDKYGNPIEGGLDPAFFKFILNRAFRMIPLSPTIMSMGGQASNSIPGFEEELEREGARYKIKGADKYQTDITKVIEGLFSDSDTASKYNWALWLSRAFFGTNVQIQMGRGPVYNESVLRTIEFYARKKSQEENELRKRFEEIHGILPGTPNTR
jgi:hypothetical protein